MHPYLSDQLVRDHIRDLFLDAALAKAPTGRRREEASVALGLRAGVARIMAVLARLLAGPRNASSGAAD